MLACLTTTLIIFEKLMCHEHGCQCLDNVLPICICQNFVRQIVFSALPKLGNGEWSRKGVDLKHMTTKYQLLENQVDK